jgi:hypothetical protein
MVLLPFLLQQAGCSFNLLIADHRYGAAKAMPLGAK